MKPTTTTTSWYQPAHINSGCFRCFVGDACPNAADWKFCEYFDPLTDAEVEQKKREIIDAMKPGEEDKWHLCL